MNDEKLLPGDIIVLSETVRLMLSVPNDFQEHEIIIGTNFIMSRRVVTVNDMVILSQHGTYPKNGIYFHQQIKYGQWCE